MFWTSPRYIWSQYNSSFLAVSQSQSKQSWQMSILSDFPFPKDLDSFRCRNNKLISFFALPVYSHYSSLLSLTRRCRFSLYQATPMLYPHFTEKDPRNNTTCYLSLCLCCLLQQPTSCFHFRNTLVWQENCRVDIDIKQYTAQKECS